MTLAELMAQFRIDADDVVSPYAWADTSLAKWFTEAQAEAAIRARLLHESDSPAVCQIAVAAGKSTYPLHEALYEIDHMGFKATGATLRQPVKLISREELDRIKPDWRDCTGRVDYAIQADTSIRLALTPTSGGTLFMEGFRLPLAPLANPDDLPEIHPAHHEKLVLWALFRAFSVPDAETIDKDRAEIALTAFTDYFGARPDADLRRSTREDDPPHNRADWP